MSKSYFSKSFLFSAIILVTLSSMAAICFCVSTGGSGISRFSKSSVFILLIFAPSDAADINWRYVGEKK